MVGLNARLLKKRCDYIEIESNGLGRLIPFPRVRETHCHYLYHELIHRLNNQGAHHLCKIIQRLPDDFTHFRVETEDMFFPSFELESFLFSLL